MRKVFAALIVATLLLGAPRRAQQQPAPTSSGPAEAAALVAGGRALIEERQPAEAEDVLRRAVEAAPDSADAWFQLGRALDRQDKADEASPPIGARWS
jgi:Flp pilus assembly protein TadD